jgi:DNA-binding NarL/FixJ family response regulator
MGLVLKEKPGDVLLKAIERVHAGEIWIDRTVIASVITEMTRHSNGEEQDSEEYKINSLTAREREVVTLVGEGLKNRDIAARLFISETTVRHHLTSIFDKLGVSDRFELAIYAYRHGLARVPV